MPAAEDVERQVAVAVVVAVEEPAFLLPVQRIIGGIEIERDLRRGFGVGIKEQIDEQGLDGRAIGGNVGIAGWLVAAELQPVQRALAGQRRAVAAGGRQLARKRRQHRIVAQLIVVDEVLIAERNADNALHNQRLDGVLGKVGIAAVIEAWRPGDGSDQGRERSAAPSKGAAFAGDGATIERTQQPFGLPQLQTKTSFGLHCVGIGDFLCYAIRLCSRRTFADSEPPSAACPEPSPATQVVFAKNGHQIRGASGAR